MRNRWRIVAVTLVALATALVGVAVAQPANAADVIAISNAETGLCATPAGWGNGAPVVQQPCVDGSRAQLWTRIHVGGGLYNMINVEQSTMCMDVRDANNPVQIWSCGSSRTMRWSFKRVFLPFDNIKSWDGRCLDTLGTGIVVNKCVDQDSSQVWQIR